MREGLRKVGAPVDLIQHIEEPSIPRSQELMRQVDLVLATGGAVMVKAAYSSGTPAYGVGAGNPVIIVAEDADIQDSAEKITISNRVMKPYWGEGSARARAWKAIRYRQAHFEEGVEGFVEYAGGLRDNLQETLAKIKSSMSSCGAATIRDLHEHAELELVSALAIREGQVHDIFRPREEIAYHATSWGH